ncbi:MAG: RNA methyltransferase [Pseudomonadota bacterium]
MLHKISSASNPLIKTLKTLHAKKGRAETGLFLAEGARLAAEASELGIWPEVMVVSEAALERPQVRALVEAAGKHGVRCVETNEATLAQISKRDNPQTIIGAYRQRLASLDTLGAELVIALEGVRDPGNLGTILRTADSIGANGVVLVGPSCDPFSVEAVRASMGSIFAMPLARASFDELLHFKSERGAALIGASLKGTELDPNEACPARVVLLMGNEQSGLPAEMERACDLLVRIPMRGRADSLNLAIATAVLSYDIWRRRSYAGAR